MHVGNNEVCVHTWPSRWVIIVTSLASRQAFYALRYLPLRPRALIIHQLTSSLTVVTVCLVIFTLTRPAHQYTSPSPFDPHPNHPSHTMNKAQAAQTRTILPRQ